MKIKNKGCSLTAFWLLIFIIGMLAMQIYPMTSTVSGKVIDKETGKQKLWGQVSYQAS